MPRAAAAIFIAPEASPAPAPVDALAALFDLTAFAKIDVAYKPQKADGSLDAGIHFKYDLKASKGA